MRFLKDYYPSSSSWPFFSQVSEIKAEYFPPKVDIILQNEIPTDFYIIAAGAMV